MVMRYPIPRILNACADFILDSSSMVMSVDLFNKARVFLGFSTTLKAVFNLAASSLTTDSYRLDNLFRIAYTVLHQGNCTSLILFLDIRAQPTR
jgi:hypothetical protein